MKSLADFPEPIDHEVAVCEVNGQVHYMDPEYANVKMFTTSTEAHPKIHITRDQLHPASSGDEGKALFLPVNVPFLKQLTQVYYEQGPLEALQLARAKRQFFISQSAAAILGLYKYYVKLRLILNPNIRYCGPTLIGQLSPTRNWPNSTVRFISWHPYCTKLAVVTCDDIVRVFSSESTHCPLLRCRQQKNVTCVAWRPLSNSEIAVSYEDGIIIWNVDSNSLVLKPSVSNALILQRADHKPIMNIAWSLRGDTLVSVAACDNTILVWNPELNQTSSLKRPGGLGHVLAKWSPTGEKLFTCSNSIVFRVWDVRNWECERWTIPTGRIQSACWSNCGTTLLFTTNTEPIIYAVIVKNELVFAIDSDSSSNQALPIYDLSKIELGGMLVGGFVQCMETDPKGKHLAIMFQDTSAIAVFIIAGQPSLQLIPRTLIVGMPEEVPSFIAFQQNFIDGACLTIGWSSGRIQYYPIVYSDLNERTAAANGAVYQSLNSTSFI